MNPSQASMARRPFLISFSFISNMLWESGAPPMLNRLKNWPPGYLLTVERHEQQHQHVNCGSGL
jgi:hypothetical protein